MALPYNVIALNLMRNDQKHADFLKINPNGRIPAMVDRDAGDFAVFESGAILLYLADKSGQLMPRDAKGRSRVEQWPMFQMGGIGPMQGQANWFKRNAPDNKQGIDRYVNESLRLYGVLDRWLKEHEFLAGAYSIAHIANWGWVSRYEFTGLDISGMPNPVRWYKQIAARPAVLRGAAISTETQKARAAPWVKV